MSPTDAFFHLWGAVSTGVLLGVFMAVAVKALWRQAASGLGWVALAARFAAVAVAADLGLWAVMGAQGTMAAHAAMVLAVASTAWVLMRRPKAPGRAGSGAKPR